MKKYFSFAHLLYYFLTLVVFFLAGVTVAVVTDAAAGQGMAGAATVLGYGIMGSILALVVAIALTPRLAKEKIVLIDKILFVVLLSFVVFFVVRAAPASDVAYGSSQMDFDHLYPTVARSGVSDVPVEPEAPLGLGVVKPDLFGHSVLYFYSTAPVERTANDLVPSDSLVFTRSDLGIEISYAPPWFVPEFMKMDYEILFMKALSIHHSFLEVEVNRITGRTAFIDRFAAEIVFWPEFLISIDSVEPLNIDENPVRDRPFDHSDPVQTGYSFLQPVKATDQWLQVSLRDDDMRSTGSGWLRWNSSGSLAIRFSLLR